MCVCEFDNTPMCLTPRLCFCPTVLTEGGQVRGGDQGSYRQAEGGELTTVGVN